MSNDFYTPSGSPSTGSTGSSATMRGEFTSIQSAFDKLPPLNLHGLEFVRVNAGGTALESLNNTATQAALNLAIGVNVQAWDADLDGLAALDATVGILIKTAAATYARRNVVGTANEITVTNGNGVAGNITVSLPNALTFTGKTIAGGTFNNSSITNASILGSNNAQITGGSLNNVAVTNSTATTQNFADNSTKIATTAYVDQTAGLKKLTSGTNNAIAALNIVMTAYTAFPNKILVLERMLPDNDGVTVKVRLSTDGGVSYDSTAGNYSWKFTSIDDTAASTTVGSASDDHVEITELVGNSVNEGMSGKVEFFAMSNTALWPRFEFSTAYVTNDATPRAEHTDGLGIRRTAQDTDAVQLFFSAGNINAVSWALYGYG